MNIINNAIPLKYSDEDIYEQLQDDSCDIIGLCSWCVSVDSKYRIVYVKSQNSYVFGIYSTGEPMLLPITDIALISKKTLTYCLINGKYRLLAHYPEIQTLLQVLCENNFTHPLISTYNCF